MTILDVLLFIILCNICLFTLINRICQCIEHCVTAKAFSDSSFSEINKGLFKTKETIKKFDKNNG